MKRPADDCALGSRRDHVLRFLDPDDARPFLGRRSQGGAACVRKAHDDHVGVKRLRAVFVGYAGRLAQPVDHSVVELPALRRRRFVRAVLGSVAAWRAGGEPSRGNSRADDAGAFQKPSASDVHNVLLLRFLRQRFCACASSAFRVGADRFDDAAIERSDKPQDGWLC